MQEGNREAPRSLQPHRRQLQQRPWLLWAGASSWTWLWRETGLWRSSWCSTSSRYELSRVAHPHLFKACGSAAGAG